MKNFEKDLSRLEELGSRIKDSSLTLEETVNCFDEGIKLARGLEKELKKIEKRVEILLNEPEKDQGETPELELFRQEESEL